MPQIFVILSPYVRKNNGLLNKITGITLSSEIKVIARVTFFLYLGYPWTNSNKISATMMASWPAKKNLISADLENVGQGHHLQNLLYYMIKIAITEIMAM